MLRAKHRFNKIFLDINGSRDVSAIAKLISIYADGWENSNATGAIETIVVKNWRMANLLRSTRMTAELLGNAQCRMCGHCSTQVVDDSVHHYEPEEHAVRKDTDADQEPLSGGGEAMSAVMLAVAAGLLGVAVGCVMGRRFR